MPTPRMLILSGVMLLRCTSLPDSQRRCESSAAYETSRLEERSAVARQDTSPRDRPNAPGRLRLCRISYRARQVGYSDRRIVRRSTEDRLADDPYWESDHGRLCIRNAGGHDFGSRDCRRLPCRAAPGRSVGLSEYPRGLQIRTASVCRCRLPGDGQRHSRVHRLAARCRKTAGIRRDGGRGLALSGAARRAP